MLSVGSIVEGKYKILSEIGRGGMSVVWLAINERANKTWAIKECRKDGNNNSDVVGQNLIAETEMLKKLDHPHLPSIVDVIDMGDSFLIVMDYIEGKGLDKLLKHSGAQPVDDVVEWTKQLCDVLGYLHGRTPPIIYRDMKPSNVMLKPDGNVMLIDFGTAREYKGSGKTEDTTNLGTRGYAAPEQFGGRGETDARTDIYCLGATMYHLLTGRSPADTNLQILPLRQLNPAFAGSGIEKVVAKCCEPNPENRYQSCAELMYALEHVHDGDDTAIRKRNMKWVGFVTSLVLLFMGIVGMIGFKVAANSAEASTYDYYITQAKSAEGSFSMAAVYYKQAINLRPSNQDAYLELLSAIESDVTFTVEENTSLTACIMETDGGARKNIDYLKTSNNEAYDEFVYRLANNYYFFYEGSDNRVKAAQWYGKILESSYLDAQKLELANSLYTIGNYYSSLGDERNVYAVGSDSSDYLTFWNEMVELTDGDVVAKTGGTRYAIALYKEMVFQIYNNATKFKAFGVSQQNMQAQLDKISDGMVNFVPETTAIANQIQTTKDLVGEAEKMVNAAFTAVGGN